MNTLTHKNIYSFLPLPFSIGRDTKGIFNILKFQSIKMIKKMIYDVCLIIKQKNRIGVTFIFRLNQANTRLSCLILFPWFCIVLMFDKNFLLTTKLKNPRSLIRNKNKNYFYKLLKPIYFFSIKKSTNLAISLHTEYGKCFEPVIRLQPIKITSLNNLLLVFGGTLKRLHIRYLSSFLSVRFVIYI